MKIITNGGEIWGKNVKIIRETRTWWGAKRFLVSVDGEAYKQGGWHKTTFLKCVKPEHLIYEEND